MFCCSTLGLEGAVSLSKGVETAEKMEIFFFFHKPVSACTQSIQKPVSSDYNASHFMKLTQVPLVLLKAELMEELNCLLYVRRLMLADKNQDYWQRGLSLNCVSLRSTPVCNEQKSLAPRLFHIPLTFSHANIPQDTKDEKL